MGWQSMLLLLLHLFLLCATAAPPPPEAKQGCQELCGDVRIPYPFGINEGCFRKDFNLTCNSTFSPSKLFLGTSNIEVLEIRLDDGLLRIKKFIAHDCYSKNGSNEWHNRPWISLGKNRPYRFSNTRNKFVAVGCDTRAYLTDQDGKFSTGCASRCNDTSYVVDGSCSGIGCCEVDIPKGLRGFKIQLFSYYNHSNCFSFDPCSYAFLVDNDSFTFHRSDFLGLRNTTKSNVTLEWSIGNVTCEDARKDPTADFACVAENSECHNTTDVLGYRCHCSAGYQGNPYLRGGCQDIDECNSPNPPCIGRCKNTAGSYTCICPWHKKGDGKKDGSGCIAKYRVLTLVLGVGIGLLCLSASGSWLYSEFKKRKLMRLKEKFFQQNGGLLLQQQISNVEGAPSEGAPKTMRIFTLEELQKATNNYHEDQILGRGGSGTVYKGVLPDQNLVAVKRSKITDQGQIEQFINEVVVLSQINHRNVVKLLGCCLETEVPLLVYEFVPNGTLSHHIHDEGRKASLSWENRLRIASQTAGALAYLHSSASVPIIHRDVKSTNILLDESSTAKVSDFGSSRLVPFDKKYLNSLVQGTFGYLDPEYLQSGEFTDKSDVYSFGVVLVELLTGEKPISSRAQGNGNLVSYFKSCIKENRLESVLEERVHGEGHREQLVAITKLAKRCLRLKGEDRPTMKEVAMELEGLRSNKHPWVKEEEDDEAEPLLVRPVLDDPTFFGASIKLGEGTFSEGDSSNNGMLPFNVTR